MTRRACAAMSARSAERPIFFVQRLCSAELRAMKQGLAVLAEGLGFGVYQSYAQALHRPPDMCPDLKRLYLRK